MIHVCYVTNDGYCSHTSVSAVSVFENNRQEEVCVHILAENISEKNRRLLQKTADAYPNGTIDIRDCTGYVERIKKEFNPQGWKGTCNAYLYVYMQEIFSDLDRVLWIDVDTVVLGSLKELWQTDLFGMLTGAILDIPSFISVYPDDPFWKSKFYFNGGVLLLNLKEIRERSIDALLQDWLRREGAKFRFPDQTLLNLAFPEDSVKHLDLRYDFPAGISERSYKFICKLNSAEKPTMTVEEYNQSRKNIVILHYIGGPIPGKPWFTDSVIWGREHYIYYRSLSPYADVSLKPFNAKGIAAKIIYRLSVFYDTYPSALFGRFCFHCHRILFPNKHKNM